MIKVTKENGTKIEVKTRRQAQEELANIIYAMRLLGITDEEVIRAVASGLAYYDEKQEKKEEK